MNNENTKHSNAVRPVNEAKAVRDNNPGSPKEKRDMGILSKLIELASQHPVAACSICVGALVLVGGGIYFSHDAMRHGYNAEMSIMKLFTVKLTKNL
jgi:hypothetical protein